MLIEKADMLDALLGYFAGMDLLTDATEGNCVVLGYVAGWLDAIGTLIQVENKKYSKACRKCEDTVTCVKLEGESGE